MGGDCGQATPDPNLRGSFKPPYAWPLSTARNRARPRGTRALRGGDRWLLVTAIAPRGARLLISPRRRRARASSTALPEDVERGFQGQASSAKRPARHGLEADLRGISAQVK